MADSGLCSIPDCSNSAYIRGWCSKHYNRWRKHGDPMKRVRPANGEARDYFEKVVIAYSGADCLIWPYYRMKNGYAVLNISGSPKVVSRLCCERVNGPAPQPEYEAAHTCGKGHMGCVNPRHLTWKTRRENEADKVTHGTVISGNRHPRFKYDRSVAERVRSLEGTMTHRELSKHFGISLGSIGQILRREIHPD